jgi:lipopolysaccharide export LptBFGC system permease protein LptF
VWRFHRYYLREILTNAGMTFVMLFGISLLALAAKGITRSQGADMVTALWITLLWSTDSIHHLIPISLLVGTVFTFGRAAADNEITAIRMAGVSPLRLMGAVLIAGSLASGTNSLILHNLVPMVHYLKYRPFKNLVHQFLQSNRASGNRLQIGKMSMTWEKKEGNCYQKVVFDLKHGVTTRVGWARQACFEARNNGRILVLKLFDTEGHESVGKQKGRERQFKFGELELTFDIRDLIEKNKRREGVKDLETAQLWAEFKRGQSRQQGEIEWRIWRRTTQAWAAFFFVLVAFPIGVMSRRAGRMVAFAFSFMPLFLYYVLSYIAPKMARSTDSVLPVFLPSAGLFVVALFLNRKAFRR